MGTFRLLFLQTFSFYAEKFQRINSIVQIYGGYLRFVPVSILN